MQGGVIKSFQKKIVTSWLHVNVLPVARFLIPEYLTYKNEDCAIEVFLLIAAFKLMGSFLFSSGSGKWSERTSSQVV
jgi:hypothetical protein